MRGVLRRGSVRARAGGALLALLLVGCVPAPEAASPAAVVDAYFRFLGRDPMRTLPLLADAFHRRHGLGVVTAGGAAAAAPAPPPAPAAVSLDRLQLGWLAVQGRDAFRALRDTLAIGPLEVAQAGDRAEVTVEVAPANAPPFVQRFELRPEGAARGWRIAAIEQSDVAAASLPAAFVAYPNEATRRRLAGGAGPER